MPYFANDNKFTAVPTEFIKKQLPQANPTFVKVYLYLLMLASENTGVSFADIASAPGGADADEAKARGINYLFLPGLPGKYSPVTAAQIIFKTITNIGKEANLWNLGEKE